jgi:murein DD-endopeptidase MepM/ murein hydrolase activator NlpD
MNKPSKIIVLIIGTVLVMGILMSNQASASASLQAKSEVATGYRLMVDGTGWGVVADRAALEKVLEDYKQSMVKKVEGEVAVESVEFKQRLEITEVQEEKSSFITIDEMKKKIESEDTSEIVYTVKKGDSVWAIAKSNNIPLSTIIQYNPDLDPERIWAGNTILFQPKDPVIDVVTSLTTTIVESIEYSTQYINDSSLAKGQRIVVKKGVEGSKKVTYDIQLLNGYVNTNEIVNEEQVTAPVNAVVKIGTKVTLVRTSTRNFGVVVGRLSSNYGYRRDPISGQRAFHTGIDIAASYGSPVYAYASGKVVESTSNSIRGNYITIDHGNGIKTSYLHLSSRMVSVGQTVTVGQQIGKVGSTGYATGNHLHFTVIKNGTIVSPWDYL